MAAWTTARFGSAKDMVDYLNGAIIGSVDLTKGADVDGKTFIYDVGSGAQTVTFSPAKSRNWTAAEIVSKINASEAGLSRIKNVGRGRFLVIDKDVVSIQVVETGTANTDLGFSTTAATDADKIAMSEVQYAGIESGEQSWVVVRYA